ncbi:sigma-E factor negative regulatory protein [Variovorax sp. PBL-E5]|uniref:sigma-E factor negative regulatory protein n=1 Tax=Variovorax sp. PBL-E5 TaxID=434014 RepID=UPI001318D5B5|nr:sigma-E factor negative regulatory protein [Variovorax sp. PBL-E5]VTU35125.1 anti-RNA polymerase sigma factor SigE [Variovorax sp. PBL-E5]
MNHTSTGREQVSALVDGYLQGDEFAQAIGKVGSEGELRATWHTYHLVGDVLRSGVHTACSDSSEFLSRLQRRLEAEPAAPVSLFVEPQPAATPRLEAANEPVFRWKLVAGAASLAAAAAIGWNWVGGSAAPQPGDAQLAQQQTSNSVLAASISPQQAMSSFTPTRVVVGSGGPQVMLRDPRLDQLLEAHRQVGGAQMPSGFLRNATFEGPSR